MNIEVKPIRKPEPDETGDNSTADIVGSAIVAIAANGGGMVKVDEVAERRSPIWMMGVKIARKVRPDFDWSLCQEGPELYIVGEPNGRPVPRTTPAAASKGAAA